ncbi:KLTH0D05764p [Lachancea thermotolerans CBS 6340]|uniref:KLTH0D05764p n=1 Tax=Lachancea thermotolerans (strain ATCC 56472 / CBS 6340 / NRRL Y-8284) TaxID=559295 RepID=C5DGJ3_LACTC|nr:KLTH0D05764p [Lachancea thermotolerans CBS 6340]CAR22535.1 KLTH0D05764p [Lachancea thermotolerans CBS 6340]
MEFSEVKDSKKVSCCSRASDPTENICECEDELDIFERFVQDPCMNAWEDLDEEGRPSQWEDDELDPVCEGVEGFARKQVRTSKPCICSNCHHPRRWKTSSTAQDFDEPVLRCSRTNSFMSQLSRQASRQSLPDPGEGTCGSPTHPGYSQPSLEIGPSRSNSVSRTRSRSSFGASSAIPAHIYCLERFVSSELDSAAENFCRKDPLTLNTVSPTTSTICSPSGSDSATSPQMAGVLSSSSSTNSAKNNADIQPVFLSKRKSRVSSIEVSLLNSFS